MQHENPQKAIPHQTFDAVIIGAGLGGLLSAVQLLQCHKRVVLVERLSHCGGRFTAKTFRGVQVSTGAVHMVPFGSSGVLAHMLRHLRVPHRLFDADVFGSFHVGGRHVYARGLLGIFKFLGPCQCFWFARIGYLMFLCQIPASESELPFSIWLERHMHGRRNPELRAFFERISRFALSLELDQVHTSEVVRTTKNMLRYGAPGIVEGGCAALTTALEQCILDRGGQLLLHTEAMQILTEGGHAVGVRVRDKSSHEESILRGSAIISDIGPRATQALLQNQRVSQADVLKGQKDASIVPLSQDIPEAVGLKVHLLSDISLIPHKGIMYCLDTQRIAGIVQPTNCDPQLAPEGKHLLISHQVIQSNNLEEEKALALADLRMVFGEAFEKYCHVLTMSVYRGEWPVNRLAQGMDVATKTDMQSLYLVGDAIKPSGYLMVEGVAQSVNQLMQILDEEQEGRREQKLPSRFNALRWLWKAPGNA